MTSTQPPAVIVTGAASGIGAALVGILRAAGTPVIGLDRKPAEGIHACDLADPEAIAAFARDLTDPLGGLANVAGVPGTAPPEVVLTVNSLAPRLLAEATCHLLAPGAAIVNVASVAAHRNTQPPPAVADLMAQPDTAGIREWLRQHPIDGSAAYDTSKRVLVDWTVHQSAALLGQGVRCLSVSPGPVSTPILDDFKATMGHDAIDRSEAAVGRHARPDEIAAVVAFALSPAASWLNGIDITADGGLLAARAATRPVLTGGTNS